MTALDADLFAAAVIKMEGAITWDELEVVCRQLDARYEAPELVIYRDMKDLMALDPPMPILDEQAS